MLFIALCLAAVTPQGQEDAIAAFSQGDLYLVTFGRQSEGIHRDTLTGIRYRSLGCAVDREMMEYQEDWNDFMLNLWSFLGSDSTYFILRIEDESIEYTESVCIYSDRWGSVPFPVMPEELSHMAWLATRQVRVEADSYGELWMYSALWDDTLRATVPVSGDVIQEILARGRTAIRMN